MAHRPSALAAMNKIMVLHGGMVAQFGDKADLVTMQGKAPAGGLRPADAPPRAQQATVEEGASVEPLTELPKFISNRIQAKMAGMDAGAPVDLAPAAPQAEDEPTRDEASETPLTSVLVLENGAEAKAPMFRTVLSRSA